MAKNTHTSGERRGLPRERRRSGGTFLFLFAIGALVAGAGIAGLEYADAAGWAPTPHSENAPPTEPFEPTKLTSADDIVVPTAEEVVRGTLTDAGATIATADAGHPPAIATPKPRPVIARPRTMPPKVAPTPDEDPFSKPD